MHRDDCIFDVMFGSDEGDGDFVGYSVLELSDFVHFSVSNYRSLVLRLPVVGEYSQLRIPKKSAAMTSSLIAVVSGEDALVAICLNTESGRHFS